MEVTTLKRICESIFSKSGNIKLSWVKEDNQLEFHPDKTWFVVMGSRKYKEEARGQVMEEPIRFGYFTTMEKKVEKYLGDMFTSEGQDIGDD